MTPVVSIDVSAAFLKICKAVSVQRLLQAVFCFLFNDHLLAVAFRGTSIDLIHAQPEVKQEPDSALSIMTQLIVMQPKKKKKDKSIRYLFFSNRY
jgi:hypothetical protein